MAFGGDPGPAWGAVVSVYDGVWAFLACLDLTYQLLSWPSCRWIFASDLQRELSHAEPAEGAWPFAVPESWGGKVEGA